MPCPPNRAPKDERYQVSRGNSRTKIMLRVSKRHVSSWPIIAIRRQCVSIRRNWFPVTKNSGHEKRLPSNNPIWKRSDEEGIDYPGRRRQPLLDEEVSVGPGLDDVLYLFIRIACRVPADGFVVAQFVGADFEQNEVGPYLKGQRYGHGQGGARKRMLYGATM